jgi:predicted kinase
MLIIVCGLPGTGKSSLSARLAEAYSAEHLNSDVIRKELFERPSYTEEEKEAVYKEMARKAEELLGKGSNVILDATFYRHDYRKMMADIAEKAGKRTYRIKCTLPEEEIRGRLAKRKIEGMSASDADYDVYQELKGRFEPLEGLHLEVDTSVGDSEVMEKIKEFIGEG